MSNQESSAEANSPPAAERDFADLLVNAPPGWEGLAANAVRMDLTPGTFVETPEILLPCESEICVGVRNYKGISTVQASWYSRNPVFLAYKCRNCGNSERVFALIVTPLNRKSSTAFVEKLGESPGFGPPPPAKVMRMVEPDRELFLKGLRAERQSLGIGSFAYYRRVVDSNWRQILAEVIKVAEQTPGAEGAVQTMKAALEEDQFSKAVKSVKDAVPASLRIDNHNPITLLYSATSEGLHGQDDSACLDRASAIRNVLIELAERTQMILAEKTEVRQSVAKLLRRTGEG